MEEVGIKELVKIYHGKCLQQKEPIEITLEQEEH